MPQFAAALQFRTTLDQAGRIAGLAGELDVSESEIVRMLIDRALEPRDVLKQLRAELRQAQKRQEEALAEFSAEEGSIPASAVRMSRP